MNRPVADPRERQARDAAKAAYLARGEHFANQELMLGVLGEHIHAMGAHEYALRVLNAYIAEEDDPEPSARAAPVCCGACMVYMNLPSEAKAPRD